MSVTTEADEMLDRIGKDINEGIKNLQKILYDIEDIWGSNEYSNKYKLKMEKACRKLLKARLLLNR